MYTLALRRSFEAIHYLVGGDWGAENQPHSHPYVVEVQMMGEELNEHGYLVDLVDVEGALEELIGYFRGHTLNDLPEFSGLNPSIEHFARIFAERFAEKIASQNLTAVRVQLWEAEDAWASFYLDLK